MPKETISHSPENMFYFTGFLLFCQQYLNNHFHTLPNILFSNSRISFGYVNLISKNVVSSDRAVIECIISKREQMMIRSIPDRVFHFYARKFKDMIALLFCAIAVLKIYFINEKCFINPPKASAIFTGTIEPEVITVRTHFESASTASPS